MQRNPVLFVSHGAPTFAIEPGRLGPRLAALGQRLPRPQAVLVVSPHWTTRTLRVATTANPETIHDFGGFPDELYSIQYPAPGHPQLAQRTLELLRERDWKAEADAQRGLDHGAWVPIRFIYPDADVPVFQVSLTAGMSSPQAYALGEALRPLRDEGVLIVGSGSLTHNLYEFRVGQGAEEAQYAREFADWIRSALKSGDRERVVDALAIAPHARRAHPTAEHFLPLLVAAGAAQADEPVETLEGGITYGVLAMDSYLFGAVPAANAG